MLWGKEPHRAEEGRELGQLGSRVVADCSTKEGDHCGSPGEGGVWVKTWKRANSSGMCLGRAVKAKAAARPRAWRQVWSRGRAMCLILHRQHHIFLLLKSVFAPCVPVGSAISPAPWWLGTGSHLTQQDHFPGPLNFELHWRKYLLSFWLQIEGYESGAASTHSLHVSSSTYAVCPFLV